MLALLDLTLPCLEDNLALDEALLQQAEAGLESEVLRLWEWPEPAVVLGSGCGLAADVDEAACRADGVPIVRRSSGGGTVLLGPGCLLFSLVLSYDRATQLRGIASSYAWILERMAAGLADLVPDIQVAGTSDLVVHGLKFSGNAQQRKQQYLLHHGTLLYAFDLNRVRRYLRLPVRQPAYRAGREHAAFMMNLPVSAGDLRRCLKRAWSAERRRTDWPRDTVRRLVVEKYSQRIWTRRFE